jgi:hypothetical protein
MNNFHYVYVLQSLSHPQNKTEPPTKVDMGLVFDSNGRRAKCGRVSNPVGGEPAVISTGILLVDLDSTGYGRPLC